MQSSNRYIQKAGQDGEDTGGYKVYKNWRRPEYWRGIGSQIRTPAFILAWAAILLVLSGLNAPLLIVMAGSFVYHGIRWAIAAIAIVCVIFMSRACLARVSLNRSINRRCEEMLREEEQAMLPQKEESPALEAALRMREKAHDYRDYCYTDSIMDCCDDLEMLYDLGDKYRKLMQDNKALRERFQQTLDPVVYDSEKKAAERADRLVNYITIEDRDAVSEWSEKMHSRNMAQADEMEQLLRTLADYEADLAEADEVDIAPYEQRIRQIFEG